MYTSSVVYFCRLCWFTTLEYFSLFLLTCLWILWYRHNLWMIVGHLRFSVHVAALLKFYIFSIVVILSLLLWVLFFLDHKGFFRGSLLNFVSISVVFLLFLSSSMRVWFWVLSLFFWSQFSLSVSIHSSTCFALEFVPQKRQEKVHVILSFFLFFFFLFFFFFNVKCMRRRWGERSEKNRNWRTPVFVLPPRNGKVHSMNVHNFCWLWFLVEITFLVPFSLPVPPPPPPPPPPPSLYPRTAWFAVF